MRIYTYSILLVFILGGLLVVGCDAGEETVTDADATATQVAENEEPNERATTAIEDAVDEVQDDEDDVTATQTVTTSESVTTTDEITETGEGAETEATENTVTVEMTEYEIRMPTTLPAGPTQFDVTNVGTAEHNFEVEGQGIEVAFDSNLQVGETKRLQVDLSPDTYKVYCPVDEHAEKGMELELTVTE